MMIDKYVMRKCKFSGEKHGHHSIKNLRSENTLITTALDTKVIDCGKRSVKGHEMKTKRWLVGIGSAAILALSAVGVMAQSDGNGGGFGGRGNRGGDLTRSVVELVLQETGLTREEIRVQLQDGATLATIIEDSGASVDTITEQVTVLVSERAAQAVENGRLTQEQADVLITELETRLNGILTGEITLREGRGIGREGRAGMNLISETLQTLTGLTAREIRAQLRAGDTLSGILQANEIDQETFTQAALDAASAQLTARVEAGTITQEQADALLAEFTEKLTERLNNTASV
jgi:hypothetical protein